MTPQDVRNRIDEVIREAEAGGASEVSVALERLDSALETVLGELGDTITPASSMVTMNQSQMCRQMGAALGARATR